MKIHILAIGKKMPKWVDTAFADYHKRFGREINVILTEIKPEKRGSHISPQKAMELEHQRIMAALPETTHLIVLDERGHHWTSTQLAQHLKGQMASGQNITFVIGGADGLMPELKQKAQVLLQLSAMTLPHALVRVLLIEQLYRGYSILNHHPYHRE